MTYPWHLYLMGAIYVFAGVMHFIKPKMYLRIMPRYLPNHKLLALKAISIYGIILMLLLFLMVHIYMLTEKKASAGLPKWILLLRLPLQFGLMYWAFWYLKF